MKNIDRWMPTKAVLKDGKLVPNLPAIFGGSYHTIKIQLQAYHKTLIKFAKGDLIDLGCGALPYFECYKDRVSSVVCADRFGNDFTDVTVDLNSSLPFESDRFDTILLSDVINHVSRPDNLFCECHRILKKHGHLIIFTPFLYWISEAPNDYHRFTKFGLEKKCDEHNFEIAELFSYGKRRDVILDLVFKKYSSRLTFRFLKAISDILFPVGGVDYGFQSFPLGYILVAKRR